MDLPETFQSETELTSNGALAMALQRAQPFAEAARSSGTLSAYARCWNTWLGWCRDHHTMPVPAAPQAVAAFLAELARQGRSISSVNVALSAILFHARAAGHALDRKHPAIGNVMAGITRRSARPVRRARPLALDDLRALVASIAGDDLRALRDRALILVGFFAALRRSEIVSLDVTGRSPFELRPEGLMLHLTATKASAATEAVAVPRRTDALCPVAALERYLAVAGIKHGSLFRAVSKAGRILDRRLDATSVRYILHTRLAMAFHDLPQDALASRLNRLSPHSLRAGFVTAAADANAPEHLIQRTSRHKSVATLRSYIRSADAFAANAGRLF